MRSRHVQPSDQPLLRNTAFTFIASIAMAATIYKFTYVFEFCFQALTELTALTGILVRIHHPFLLADNRHYTFYVWRRVFWLHPVVPYLLIPGYIACTWAWFIRIGRFFRTQTRWSRF